jgi:hypothetical protein
VAREALDRCALRPHVRWARFSLHAGSTSRRICTLWPSLMGSSNVIPTSLAGAARILRIALHVDSQVDTGIMVGDRVGVGTQISRSYTRKLCANPTRITIRRMLTSMCVACFPSSPCPSFLRSRDRCLLFVPSIPRPRSPAPLRPGSSDALRQADIFPDGVTTQGGHSTGIIADKLYLFSIADALPSKAAASTICAGLTIYSPLVCHGAGPSKQVAVIGVGGLVRPLPILLRTC